MINSLRIIVVVFAALLMAGLPARAQQATVVGVDAVKSEPLSQTVPVIGRLVAPNSGIVATPVAGTIVTIRVRVGDRLDEGDVIAEIDTRVKQAEASVMRAQLEQARAIIASAKAQITLAEQELDRQTRLKSSSAFTRSRFDTATQELIKAKANLLRDEAIISTREASLKLIELDIERATIRAPFAGAVTERQATPGAYARSGDAIVKLLADRDLEIEADVPSVRIAGLKPDSTVKAELENGSSYMARVRAVLPVENPLTRTRAVRFSVDWPDTVSGLANAQSVTVMVPVGEQRQVITVHKDAIIRKAGGSLVFVVSDGKARARKVTLGEETGSRIVVVEGLEAGDLAVVRGNERLRADSDVRIQNGS